jgi:hypothetical protein
MKYQGEKQNVAVKKMRVTNEKEYGDCITELYV